MWTMVLKASSPFSMIWVAIFVMPSILVIEALQLLEEVVVQVLQRVLHSSTTSSMSVSL